jgi:hypothetical protein
MIAEKHTMSPKLTTHLDPIMEGVDITAKQEK